MTRKVTTRPAIKADAAEIALLVNIAVHGGIAQMWARGDKSEGIYDPIEAGRLEMLREDSTFGWKSVTMAEIDGEVAGAMLGYRKDDTFTAVPKRITGFMRPIDELEAESNGRWFLSMLGVHVKWRGKGIGSALLGVADAKQVETAASGVALIVEDTNDGARRLYGRTGYAVTASRPMVGAQAGGGTDWLLMVKETAHG